MAQCLDDMRSRFPELGFALYAYEPGGPVTLEIHDTSGEVFSFTEATAASAFERAFPSPPEETPPATNVFD